MASKKNLVTLLGIALVVAIIATGLFYGLVVGKLNSAAVTEQLNVVVAARDLEPGTVLRMEDLDLAPRNKVDSLVEGFSSLEEVTGLVVVAPIYADEPLVRESLAGKDSPRGGALGIPPGLRAVSIHVTDSAGVVRLLRAGHRVDAQIVQSAGVSRGGGPAVRTVLQDLEVLQVEPEPEATPGRPPLPVVTLVATPAEADALAVADTAARIRLLLRHPLDTELTQRRPVDLGGVFTDPPVQSPRNVRFSASREPSGQEGDGRRLVETARSGGKPAQ